MSQEPVHFSVQSHDISLIIHQVRETQALILAPTRELAVQIQKVRQLEMAGQAGCRSAAERCPRMWEAPIQSLQRHHRDGHCACKCLMYGFSEMAGDLCSWGAEGACGSPQILTPESCKGRGDRGPCCPPTCALLLSGFHDTRKWSRSSASPAAHSPCLTLVLTRFLLVWCAHDLRKLSGGGLCCNTHDEFLLTLAGEDSFLHGKMKFILNK